VSQPIESVKEIWCLPTVAAGLSEANVLSDRIALALILLAACSGVLFSLVGWLVWRICRLSLERGLEPYAAELRAVQVAMESGRG
jgi:hypothetical protein